MRGTSAPTIISMANVMKANKIRKVHVKYIASLTRTTVQQHSTTVLIRPSKDSAIIMPYMNCNAKVTPLFILSFCVIKHLHYIFHNRQALSSILSPGCLWLLLLNLCNFMLLIGSKYSSAAMPKS